MVSPDTFLNVFTAQREFAGDFGLCAPQILGRYEEGDGYRA